MKFKIVVVDLEIPRLVKKWGLRLGVPAVVLSIAAVALAAPVTFTSGETLQAADLNQNFTYLVPQGMIGMFASACPTGWTEYTAMRGRFPRGQPAGNAGNLTTGGSDDAVVVAHSHGATVSTDGDHNHNELVANIVSGSSPGVQLSPNSTGGYPSTQVTANAGAHTHSVTITSTGVPGTGMNLPSYQEVIFCQKN